MAAIPQDQTAFLAVQCRKMLLAILHDNGVDAQVDKDLALDLTEFFLRDIYRIDEQQRGSVSIAKLAGYWAFWVRKLKPINSPKLLPEAKYTQEQLGHINELIALNFAVELVGEIRGSKAFSDIVKDTCENVMQGTCDGQTCFERCSARYLTFGGSEPFFTEYLTYSMRNRTFGPHHFALLMENLLFSSCRFSSHGIRDRIDGQA